jgi:hypothetical protein
VSSTFNFTYFRLLLNKNEYRYVPVVPGSGITGIFQNIIFKNPNSPLQVDHGNTAVLEAVDDVHVLTGALKLFFRELKEPLIPWDCVDRLIAVCNLPSKKAKIKGRRTIEMYRYFKWRRLTTSADVFFGSSLAPLIEA